MEIPLQITFRNMAPSEAIERRIRKKVEKLELFYDRLLSCRVNIEAPHPPSQGKLLHGTHRPYCPGWRVSDQKHAKSIRDKEAQPFKRARDRAP